MASVTIENAEPGNKRGASFKKNIFWKLICLIVLFAAASCGHSSDNGQDTTGETAYQPPIVKPLAYSNERKINWDKATVKSYSPTTASFDINKLPISQYSDTSGFKPFSKPVDTEKINFNNLPQKAFDINKLPTQKLSYPVTILKVPKVIKAGRPRPVTNNIAGLFGLNDAQGLDGVIITCLYNDHNGFLWIATEKGIYRYDGLNLACYITDPMHNTLCMAEDKLGRLWMGSQDEGVAVFDPKTGAYARISQKQGLLGNRTFFMTADYKGRIWAGGSAGINIIDPQKNTISHLDTTSGLFTGRFADVKTDAGNNLWVLCGHDIGFIDLKRNTVSYLSGIPAMREIDAGGSMLCDSRDNIWISSQDNNNIAMIAIRNSMAYVLHETAKTPKNAISAFSEDLNGNIWYNFLTDIKIIDIGRHMAKDIKVAKFDGYANNIIVGTLTDKAGDTWIGTTFGLLFYRNNDLLTEHIGDQNIASVADDHNGLIYSGSNTGIRLIDRKQKTIRLFSTKSGIINDSVQNVVLFPHGAMNINTNGGFCIIDSTRQHIETFKGIKTYANATDHAGKIWIAGVNGLYVYDPSKKTLTQLGKENGITSVMTDIMIDKDDYIWAVGIDGTFMIIDPGRKTIKNIDFNQAKHPNFASTLLHDTGTVKWIGTTKGLCIIDPKKKTVTRFSVPQGLVDETVISLLKRGNTTYIGTNKGVTTFTSDPETNKLKIVSFGPEYGLDKLNVGYWMTDNLTREGEYIWGDKGLSILDLQSHLKHVEPDVFITGFSVMDEPAYFTEPVAGSTDSSLRYNVSGKVLGAYNLPANLELPYHKNSLQFSFTSRSTFKSDTAWYRYMLTGTDKTWQKKTSETSTGNYFNLPPGQYTFKVSAMANDGTWSKPAIFNFTVLPPWWQTWWARVIFILLFAALIWLIVHLRSQSLLRSKKLLEQKVSIRTQEVLEQKEELAAQRDSLEQALGELKQTQSQLIQSEKMASLGELTAGIAHEIQNPLNFVNNFSEVNTELIDELQEEIEKGNFDEVKAIATDIQENEKKISMHGKRADAIVKGMLQHSRAGSGQKEPTDINKLADEYLRLSYHGLRAKDKSFNADMVTHFDEKLPLVKVLPQEVGRVLLNMFNNAFYAVHQKQKTAGPDYKPTVTITTFAPPSGGWGAKVQDNGTGIPEAVKDKIMQPFFTTKPTGEGTGLGLSLSYDIIVKGHGGTINIESTEGQGSAFTILIPA